MTKYNKWIRDRIPQQIENAGLEGVYKNVSSKEILNNYFQKKIKEEAQEVVDSKFSEEEFADLIEVVESAISVAGLQLSRVRAIQNEKARERGPFKNNLILLETKKPGEEL